MSGKQDSTKVVPLDLVDKDCFSLALTIALQSHNVKVSMKKKRAIVNALWSVYGDQRPKVEPLILPEEHQRCIVENLQRQRRLEDELKDTRLTGQQRALISQMRQSCLIVWGALNDAGLTEEVATGG